MMAPATIRAVFSQRGSFCPAAQAAPASFLRNAASVMARRKALERASTFPGGTFRAARSGAVAAAAPPVVATIGRPRTRASPSTMP